MANYLEIVKEFFGAEGINFRERDDGRSITVPFTGENLKTIPVNLLFDPDGEHIVMADCWDVVKVAENKVEKAYALCNELNEKFRWVKFYVDSDRDIRVQLDAIMSEDNAGDVCREIVYRMVNIIDGAYIEIVRALLL